VAATTADVDLGSAGSPADAGGPAATASNTTLEAITEPIRTVRRTCEPDAVIIGGHLLSERPAALILVRRHVAVQGLT
jgi:hypothetical protein